MSIKESQAEIEKALCALFSVNPQDCYHMIIEMKPGERLQATVYLYLRATDGKLDIKTDDDGRKFVPRIKQTIVLEPEEAWKV